MTGDDMLSPFELDMWSLRDAVALRFHARVIFKITGPDVPRGLEMIIWWFIPFAESDARYDLVAAYLKQELVDKEYEATTIAGTRLPAGKVKIQPFRGLGEYMERAEAKQMAREWTDRFIVEQMRLRQRPLN